MKDRDTLLEMFAPSLTEQEIASYTIPQLERTLACLRVSNRDDLPMTNHEIAIILQSGGT